MRKLIIILVIAMITRVSDAQNLVVNGSFEQFSGCPDWMAQFDSVLFWMNPSTGSPDYYNACAPGHVNVPNSLYGFQNAHTGSARAGLYVYSDFTTDSREYIETELVAPLDAGQCYYFEMYLTFADNFKYFSSDIGVYFSDSAITGFSYLVLPFTPQIQNAAGGIDTLNWHLFSGVYNATGGETHIVIGNFKNDANTSVVLMYPSATYGNAYFYIDDVSLTPCTGISQEDHSGIAVYPVLFNDELQITIDHGGVSEFILYDTSGRIVVRKIFESSFLLNTIQLVNGMYFYELRNENRVVKNGKLVKGRL